MFDKTHIRNAIMDSKAVMYLLPKQEIKDAIVKCNDVDINALSKEVKMIFLEGNGMSVENKMIADYLDNTLDKKNTKVISMCEIRVVQDTSTII